MIHQISFNTGDRVHIDGDTSIKAYVAAVTIRGNYITYECCWMHNGTSSSSWIEEARLTPA